MSDCRETLRSDADRIIREAIHAVMPDSAVRAALERAELGDGRLVTVAIGKAAWQMAAAAREALGERVSEGIVITKYGHARGPIGGLLIREAGHPVSDCSTYAATGEAIRLVSGLTEADRVLFLISGGGSALFEKPLIPAQDWERLNRELLASGADIVEMNTVRKRFSSVKGGKFARLCAPARVFAIVLSDIIGDPLDMIASGPAAPDSSTAEQAKAVFARYGLTATPEMLRLLEEETPKVLSNVETQITGSVSQLCASAEKTCRALGYTPHVLTASLSCEAKDAGARLAALAREHAGDGFPQAFIAGGETVVRLTGDGLGGRNQELALAAAPGIAGLSNAAVFSVGSDGTDGPTDAAGGYVDGNTEAGLRAAEVDVADALRRNDSYHALEKCGGLIVTGPTGTNVNDFCVLLLR